MLVLAAEVESRATPYGKRGQRSAHFEVEVFRHRDRMSGAGEAERIMRRPLCVFRRRAHGRRTCPGAGETVVAAVRCRRGPGHGRIHADFRFQRLGLLWDPSIDDASGPETRRNVSEVVRPWLSVCIPCYAEPSDMLQVAVDSAESALPEGSELLIFPNGPEALSTTQSVRIRERARVIPSEGRLSMVSNWNRCLAESQGALIHILHADDAVAPGFYQAILGLAERYPEAALYATGFGPLGKGARFGQRENDDVSEFMADAAAARFILAGSSHCCGSVVMSEWAVRDHGLFREEYLYGPDEEAYLRYAAAGGLAFAAEPLYLERAHGEQSRIPAWMKPDFVVTYMKGRVDGASHYGEEITEVAKDFTARRVISVAVTLALRGERVLGLQRLSDLAEIHSECASWPRYRLAEVACRFPAARVAAGLRRRYLLP